MEGASVQELLKERPDIRIDSRVPTAAIVLPGAAGRRSCNRIHQSRTTSRPTQMHALRRRLLVLAAAVVAGPLTAQQLLNDDFNSNTRSNWLSSHSPSGLSAATGALSIASGRHALTYFTPSGTYQSLLTTVDSLQVTFDLSFTSVSNSSTGFRLAFLDSNGATRPTLDGTNSGFRDYDGYLVQFNPAPLSGDANLNNLRLRARQTGIGASGELITSYSTSSTPGPATTTWTQVGTRGSDPALQTFATNTTYSVTYKITRPTASSLSFDFSVTGGTLNFRNTFSLTSITTTSFDSLALMSVSSDIIIDNVNITAVPEPSTYAACAGAAVLGLAFWRRRRAAAQALAA